jgi:hypothetical protein
MRDQMQVAEEAAGELARRFGITVEAPTFLRSTNNIVVWLAPSRVVAKVGIGQNDRLAAELEVASRLTAWGAPVVGPAREVPVVVHRLRGLAVTFWTYEPQAPDAELDAESVAGALHRLHDALERYASGPVEPLPHCGDELARLRRFLRDPDFASALGPADRSLLADALDELTPQLQEAPAQVLHGSPHEFNILLVDGHPRFIDFETVCTGPRAWDLAHLSPEVAAHYPDAVDESLLGVCRVLVSAKTAGWCWASLDRGADMRWHAEHHLEVVREARR